MSLEQYKQLRAKYLEKVQKKFTAAQQPSLPQLVSQYNQAIVAALTFIEKNISNEHFNLAAMASTDAQVLLDQEKNIALLHQFLDKTIDTKTNPPHFMPDVAWGVKASLIDPVLPVDSRLFFYDAPENLGIREKYARNLLTEVHSLTDQDIYRMLELSGTQQRIKLLPLNVKSLATALDFIKKDIDSSIESGKQNLIYNEAQGYYTIPLILNLSRDSKAAVHRIAVQIFYHPVSGEISYQVDDGMSLTPEREKEYADIIEAAINSNDDAYPAFRGHTIVKADGHRVPKCSITGYEGQIETYANGYHALHSLFKNQEINKDNPIALEYANVDAKDSKELIRKFYKAQLDDLTISFETYNVFAKPEQFQKPIADKPDIVFVNKEKLNKFLEHLQVEAPSEPTPVNEAVTDSVGAYFPGVALLSFPVGVKAANLDDIQHAEYFSQIAEQVSGTGIAIPVMRLAYCDNNALKGLNSFLALSDNAPFKNLTINVDVEEADVDLLVKNLKFTLKNLSRHDVAKLQILDEKGRLQKHHLQQLQEFMSIGKIATSIDLPDAYKNTDLQRQIDSASMIYRREKNSESLKTALAKEREIAKEKAGRAIRTRKKVDFTKNLNTDVELQEGVEETVVVVPNKSQAIAQQEFGAFERLLVSDLEEAISSKSDNGFAKFEKIAGGMSKIDFVRYWNALSSNLTVGPLNLGVPSVDDKKFGSGKLVGGQIVYINRSFAGFTDKALERLVSVKHYFQKQDGLNFDQLPDGFLLIPDPKNAKAFLLHYAPTSNDVARELAPKFMSTKITQPLSIDFTERLMASESMPEGLKSLWQSLQNQEDYSRENSLRFRQFLPQLMLLNAAQLTVFVKLCGGVEHFNYETLIFIFENLEQAQDSYAVNYDEAHEKTLVSTAWMVNQFPEIGMRRDFIGIAAAIRSNVMKQHPLVTLLDSDSVELKEQVMRAKQDYQLSDKELDGLLRIYDKHGSGGLQKLLAKWATLNEHEPLVKLPSILKNTASYEKLLFNDDILQAVAAIKQFDKVKKQWWDHLYKAHQPQDDDFLLVYKSFNSFATAINDYGLAFYDVSKKAPPVFKGAGNLPSTLGRMLSILSLCRAEDRNLQWLAMSEIDLSAQAGLKAITHTKGTARACGFVIPEMALDTNMPSVAPGDLYDENSYWKAIASADNKEKAFYRYLAYQNERLPLEFYKEAKAKIDKTKYSQEAKEQLYALLVTSTTGLNYRFYIDDAKTAMEHWDSIIAKIAAVDAPVEKVVKKIQDTAIEQLFYLKEIPALPILDKLVQVSMAPFHSVSSLEIVGALSGRDNRLVIATKKLEDCNKKLEDLLIVYGNQVYLGMKFYNEADFTKARPEGKNLFEHHLAVSEAVVAANSHVEKEFQEISPVTKFLLEQISTFHLEQGDVEMLSQAMKFSYARKAFARVYPQSHPLAGREVSPTESPEVGVLRPALYVGMERLVPLLTRDKEYLQIDYLYPEGHRNANQPIPVELKAVPQKLFYYQGKRIQESEVSSVSDALVERWGYVYPVEHPQADELIASIDVVDEENLLQPAPTVAVLKAVYFYPQGHAKAGQLVPFNEKQPGDAQLKVAYCYPNGHANAGQMINPESSIEVQKVDTYYRKPNGEMSDIPRAPALLKKIRAYPDGHPRAGQPCDFLMEKRPTSREKGSKEEYVIDTLARNLLEDALKYLKDIENADNLKATDLQAFLFKINDELETIFPEIYRLINLKNEEIEKEGKKEWQALEEKSRVVGDRLRELLPQQTEEAQQEFSKLLIEQVNIENERSGFYKKSGSKRKAVDEEVKKSQEKYIKERFLKCVEESFGDRFAKDYFKKQQAGEATPQVQLLINKAFTTSDLKLPVESIRAAYDAATIEQQLRLVSLLEMISSTMSHTEKVQLFKFLNQPNLIVTSIDNYLALLQAINENGASSFIYFLQAAEKFEKQPIENLAEKATYFLTKALSQIRANENEHVKETDIVELVMDAVLAAKPDELTRDSNINPLLTTTYSQLADKLRSSRSVSDIEDAINNLSVYGIDIADIQGMHALQQDLEDFKKDEIEIVSPALKEWVKDESGTAAAAKRGIGSVVGFFKGITGNKSIVGDHLGYKEIDIPAVTRKKVKVLDNAKFKDVLTVIEERIRETKSYSYALNETFHLINELIKQYPGAKAQILSHYRHYLSFNTTDGSQIEAAFYNIGLLQREFKNLGDQNLIIGLCEHFGDIENEHSNFNYQDFLDIVKGQPPYDGFNHLSPETRKLILSTVNSLLNNDKPCSHVDIKNLIVLCSDPDSGKLYQDALTVIFQNAPFPSFEKINSWIEETKTNPPVAPISPLDKIRSQYNDWSREPVAREKENGFNLVVAKKQSKLIQGFRYTDKELEALDKAVNDKETGVRSLSTADLMAELKAIRENEVLQKRNRKNPTRLVALMAELLYRTKGLEAIEKDGKRELGRSFEINTTQYLAIHSMLKVGKHVTSQIGTGEGKSRDMMIAIACQYALGKTVDFVTADVALATRDYLEFQSFFKALNAETRLITADMPADQYQFGGIHFSDGTNLSLFRNKARSEGNWHKVIESNPRKRAGMFDEADQIFFDRSRTRFNYSAQANPSIRGMDWVYEVMVGFFSQPENQALYNNNPDKCNEDFMIYAHDHIPEKLREERMARLQFNPKMQINPISRNQLEAWQSAAITALNLKQGEHFTIRNNVSIPTKQGTKLVSQAQLTSDSGRASGSAKFSFGVHQCLHARLNMVREGRLTNDVLHQQLNTLENPFYIDPETQIVYSSTERTLLDEYDEGELIAVTGSAGAIREREEAKIAYGQNDKPMAFIEMPRHLGQQRVDAPVVIAKNGTAQQEKILQAVLAALEKGQPTLLVCENDNESLALHKFLQERLPKEKLKHINAQTPLDEEADHIKNHAGESGMITVSTAMLGRGTDIKLHGKAKDHGLSVIATYLPRERDYLQIIGRAGRFGEKGQSQLILDAERELVRLQEYLGHKVLPMEFYTATQDFLAQMQVLMDEKEQRIRLVKHIANDFRQNLTNQFFDQFKLALPKDHDKDQVLGPWQQFVDKSDKLWNDRYPAIQELLEKKIDNFAPLEDQLKDYRNALQAEWTTMRATFVALIETGKIPVPTGKQLVSDTLQETLPQCSISDSTRRLISADNAARILATPIAEKYDPAYVGRAVIYRSKTDSLKAFFLNISAAWRGEGPWFPNLKAWLHGNMSLSQLLFGSWGKPLVELNQTKPVIEEAGDFIVEDEPEIVESEIEIEGSNVKMREIMGSGKPSQDMTSEDIEDKVMAQMEPKSVVNKLEEEEQSSDAPTVN